MRPGQSSPGKPHKFLIHNLYFLRFNEAGAIKPRKTTGSGSGR